MDKKECFERRRLPGHCVGTRYGTITSIGIVRPRLLSFHLSKTNPNITLAELYFNWKDYSKITFTFDSCFFRVQFIL